jgi:hypothetical protein
VIPTSKKSLKPVGSPFQSGQVTLEFILVLAASLSALALIFPSASKLFQSSFDAISEKQAELAFQQVESMLKEASSGWGSKSRREVFLPTPCTVIVEQENGFSMKFSLASGKRVFSSKLDFNAASSAASLPGKRKILFTAVNEKGVVSLTFSQPDSND